MRHDGVDDPKRHRAALTPPRQITELPPPQGLVDVAALVVREAVGQSLGDIHEVTDEGAAEVDAQLNIMNARVARLVAGDETRVPLAGVGSVTGSVTSA